MKIAISQILVGLGAFCVGFSFSLEGTKYLLAAGAIIYLVGVLIGQIRLN